MYRRRNFNVLMIAVATLSLVIIVSLVYAGFTGQLNITGTAVGRDSKWDIHFENVSTITTTGTAKVLSNHQPVINSNNPTQIQDYEVSLTSPNDSISFTFDVRNNGNYNAKVKAINVGTPECSVNGDTTDTSAVNMCNNLTYSLTYANGSTVQLNDMLYAKDYMTLKVTLTFNDISNPALLPTTGVSISNLGIQINFEQVGSAEVGDTGEVQSNRVYHQGEKITLNNEDYWVIENSGAGQDYVVALKDEPLTVAEVNMYGGVGTENNHVNKYTQSSIGTASNRSGYGGVAYYTSESCGYINGSLVTTGCTTDYNFSDIKYVVDSWAQDKFQNSELKIIDGYSSRLITSDELTNLGCTSCKCDVSSYDWVDLSIYYWTMTPYNNSSYYIYRTFHGYKYNYNAVLSYVYELDGQAVRPVINVYKSALETNNNE